MSDSADVIQSTTLIDELQHYASMNNGGFVYVIGHPNDYVKIGKSDNPYTRLNDLQTGSPYELKLRGYTGFKEAKSVEAILHQRLESWRVTGEWFDLPKRIEEMIIDSGELKSLVSELKGGGGNE